MPRKGPVTKREVLADPIYNSLLITKIINKLMYGGKRGVAEHGVYGALKVIEDKTGKNGLEVLEQAMHAVWVELTTRSR